MEDVSEMLGSASLSSTSQYLDNWWILGLFNGTFQLHELYNSE
jgi:hypothetical protein